MGNRIDAVGLDLDGTLLETDGTIARATLEALAAAHAAAVQVFIVTGRPQADVVAIVRRAGLLGAPFPQAFVAEERDLHDRRGDGFASRQPRNGDLLAREYAMSRDVEPALRACLPDLRALDPTLEMWGDEPVRRRGFFELHFASRELAEAAAVLLQEPMGGRARLVRNGRLVALRLPGSGKGPCLDELVRSLGLAPQRVLAMGDSDNDRSMLDGGWGFQAAAPANADADIRDLVATAGGYVSRSPRGQGVAEAIRRLLGGADPATAKGPGERQGAAGALGASRPVRQ